MSVPRWLLATAVGLFSMVAIGCGGGDTELGNVNARASFLGAGDLALDLPANTAVSLSVHDDRSKVGPSRPGGQVISSGDKAEVIMSPAPTQAVRAAFSDALTRAGVQISPDAPVEVDVLIQSMYLRAYQFTHWRLPSERGSTIDVFGVFIPGPVRETAATTSLFVTIRKHGHELGFSYIAKDTVSAESKDPAIVSQVLSECLTGAVADAVANISEGIEIATLVPVTPQEFGERSTELTALQGEADGLRQALREKTDQLADHRRQLRELRARFEQERTEIEQASAAIARDREQVEARQRQLDEMVSQQRSAQETITRQTQQNEAKLREIQTAMAALDERRAALEGDAGDQADTIEAQRAALDEELAALERQRDEIVEMERTAVTMRADAERAIADVDRQQQELAAERAAQQEEADALAARAESLREQEQNLETRIADVTVREDQAVAAQSRAELIRQRFEQKEQDLDEWRKRLETIEAGQAIKTQDVPRGVIENRSPSIEFFDPLPPERDYLVVHTPRLPVMGAVFDDQSVPGVRCYVNGAEIGDSGILAMVSGARSSLGRGGSGDRDVAAGVGAENIVRFKFIADLQLGSNEIKVEAWDDDGARSTQLMTVEYSEPEGGKYLVAIGIDDYQDDAIPDLQFACADVQLIQDTFAKGMGIDDEHMFILRNEEATKDNIIELLGPGLWPHIGADDTVIIYFSGHGAPESLSDGFATYLLPVDAGQGRSFFSSAVPMSYVAEKVFPNLRAARLVFIGDTCYSGEAGEGHRTYAPSNYRSSLGRDENPVIEELGDGAGRVILTASRGTQISQEREDLGHGVFTWYLHMGLDGHADANSDGAVTVRELYDYVEQEVMAATNGTQRPGLEPEYLEEDIVLSRPTRAAGAAGER